MTSKDRFTAVCAGRRPDRIPVDYLAHHAADAAVRRHLGVGGEEELLDALGCDFFYLPGRDISQNEGALPFYKRRGGLSMDATERTCPLGIRWRRGAGASKFTVDEAVGGPLENSSSPAEILAHPWPSAKDFDFSALVEIADAHAARVLVHGLWTGIMGDCYRMRGFERFLYDVAAEPALVHALVDRATEMYLELNDLVFATLKGRMDVWFFGNDFGSQESLLLSPSMWADYFFDNIKRLCALAHSYGLKVMMHSCGAIRPLIPMLIEAGVDILDPVQVTAKGMEPAGLRKDFGGQIVFHGGVDTQRVLPFGSTEEVAVHAAETIRAMTEDGGRYIFAPSQILGSDIPTENIVAMYQAARSFI